MRILHIGKFFPPIPGGIENFVADLSAAQCRLGHDVAILFHGRPGHVWPDELPDGRRLYVSATYGDIAFAPVAPWFFFTLRRAMREFRPDLLHVHMPNVSAFSLIAGRRRKIPLVVHWHADVVSSEYDKRLRMLYPLYRPFETRLLKIADMIVATSQNYLDSSEPMQRFRNTCHMVPLGIDTARMRDDGRPERGSGRPLVLSVGRFTYYKGYENLIEAAEHFSDVEIVICGDGPQRQQLQELVERKGLANRVLLPGFVSDADVGRYLRQCDVFCLPSIERTEAFGVSLLEAMALGKPLVTTDIPGSGVTFVNQDNETGLVAPRCDPAALAQAISRLLESPQLSRAMGERASERFKTFFQIDAVAQRMDETYSQIQSLKS
jgi:rhamnosyl/mannosyltransferase